MRLDYLNKCLERFGLHWFDASEQYDQGIKLFEGDKDISGEVVAFLGPIHPSDFEGEVIKIRTDKDGNFKIDPDGEEPETFIHSGHFRWERLE